MGNPFDLADDSAYRAWRDAKLAAYPRRVEELIVPLADPRHLSATEIAALASACARANLAIYSAPHLPAADKSLALALGRQLGLERLEGNYLADEDGLSSITPSEDETQVRGDFIPYTHKPINWHTDGYYNTSDRRILGMTLHCARDAEAGGENALLDHEIAYIQLRDANPEHIDALMQPDAMTIPARMDEASVARAEQSGPVFSVDPAEGFLYMRYTARTRSIAWRSDARTQAAVKTLADILAGSEYVLTARLTPGTGLVCNNVLHTRSGFSDSPGRRRLLYRGRYYDRLRFDRAPATAAA
ncbi:MAG: TauD/TfdA family dioxygenase [Thiobacillus sp.]|nr:TauD/TfdA family dioxygenase [Thiobacillus sp.]